MEQCKNCHSELPMHHLGCPEAKGDTALYAKIESLQAKMKLHAGDICSINNENDRYIEANKELEAAHSRLRDGLRIACYCNRKELIQWLEESKVRTDRPFKKENMLVLRMMVVGKIFLQSKP